MYIFNIYEVGINVNRKSSLDYVVHIEPKNSFGSKVPLRTVNYSYKVLAGANNINAIKDDGKGNLEIQLKSDSTNIKLQINTDKTQNSSLVEIPTHKME